MIYYDYFGATGTKMDSRWQAFKVALELNFVNSVFPSGGVAGFSYLGIRLKHLGIPVARTTLAQVMRFALTFISFLSLLFVGLFFLSFDNRAGGVTLYIALSIAFVTLFGSMLGVYIVSDEKRITSFVGFLPKVLNKLLHPFTKKANVIRHRSKLKKPLMWAFLVNLSEVATIYLAYLAIGQHVNPGAVILAYSVASFAGLVSVLPGGIGVYEALMTATFASAGVPKAAALSATLIYRISTMMVFVPTGFILYQRALRKGEAERVKRKPTVTI